MESKTILEWLQTSPLLSEEVREKAIRNYHAEKGESYLKAREGTVFSLGDALAAGFHWLGSPEPKFYWGDVYQTITEKEFNPDIKAQEPTPEDLKHYSEHLESISPEAYEKRLKELQEKYHRALELLKETTDYSRDPANLRIEIELFIEQNKQQ